MRNVYFYIRTDLVQPTNHIRGSTIFQIHPHTCSVKARVVLSNISFEVYLRTSRHTYHIEIYLLF